MTCCWVRIDQRVGYELIEKWVRNVWAWVQIVWVRKIHGYETTGYQCRRVLQGEGRALREKGHGKLKHRPRWRAAMEKSCTSRTKSKSFQFAHSTQPYSDASLPNSTPPLSWLSGHDKLPSWRWCFSTQPQLNLRESFTAAVTAKTVIWK